MKLTIFPVAATVGVFLLGLTLANSADYSASEAPPSSEAKPAMVDWRSVESADYRTYLGNLQALGFPAPTVHSIVTADVIAAFAGKRVVAVAARFQGFQYW